jgi:site-specific DNA-methyltransferase (adenine-specific)
MTKELLGSLEVNRIYQLDCLEGMTLITDKSIDMILCDLPYGTTACKWDTVIPYEPLWKQYERIIKDSGAIVLTATQPFTSQLVNSNLKLFRYEWVWEKTIGTNFMFVKKQPSKKHENILVFYKKQPTYNPQMEEGKPYSDKPRRRTEGYFDGRETTKKAIENNGTRYPSTVQKFSNSNYGNVHPTQKPVELFKYLIKTYTNEGDIVLDNCIGSGTTAVAALQTGRKFIGFEKESEYFQIANKRIDNELEAE